MFIHESKIHFVSTFNLLLTKVKCLIMHITYHNVIFKVIIQETVGALTSFHLMNRFPLSEMTLVRRKYSTFLIRVT